MKVNKEDNLVSVIMPSFRHGQYIKEAITSVLSQTYTNLELIIVDNFSDDETDSVIAEFNDKRLKLFKFNNEGIIAKARNHGVQQAQGSILAFIDTDDVWLEKKLTTQLPYLISNVDYGAISTTFSPIGEVNYSNNHFSSLGDCKFKCFDLNTMIRTNYVMTSSLIMRKKDFDDLGGFDESQTFAFIEDWELWLRLVDKAGDICVLNQPLLQYRIIKKKGHNNCSVKLNLLQIANKLKENCTLSKEQSEVLCHNCYLDIANSYLEAADRKNARRYYWMAFSSTNVSSSVRVKSFVGLSVVFFPGKFSNCFVNYMRLMRGWLFC
jgi:glycosyltransferase involved in cell wall biosynthesis